MRIDLSCSKCGGNHFSLDEAVDDDAAVVCRDCGHETGTLGALKDQVAQKITGAVKPRFMLLD